MNPQIIQIQAWDLHLYGLDSGGELWRLEGTTWRHIPCDYRSPSAPPSEGPQPNEQDVAWAEWRASPSLKTGNKVLRQMRERLSLKLPEDAGVHDVNAHRDVSDQELATVLRMMLDYTPGSCHWALNVAAHRLAAAPHQ